MSRNPFPNTGISYPNVFTRIVWYQERASMRPDVKCPLAPPPPRPPWMIAPLPYMVFYMIFSLKSHNFPVKNPVTWSYKIRGPSFMRVFRNGTPGLQHSVDAPMAQTSVSIMQARKHLWRPPPTPYSDITGTEPDLRTLTHQPACNKTVAPDSAHQL